MRILLLTLLVFVFLSGCSSTPGMKTVPYESRVQEQKGKAPGDGSFSGSDDSFYQVGIASWYGGKFNGRRTANGEIYNMYKLTAAHKELPFNTIVEVENLRNRKRVIVRINDRGPFVKDRIIDLSYKAAISVDIDEIGTAPVALRIVDLIDNGKGKKIIVRKIDFSHRSEIYLQAGAFTKRGNGESLVTQLNYYSSEIKFRIIMEKGYHKVVSFKISSRDEAEKLKQVLEDLGFDTFIKEVFLIGDIR